MSGDDRRLTDTDTLDRLASATAAVLQVRMVVASSFDDGRQIFVGAHGLIEPLRSRRWTDEVNGTCRAVVERAQPILVQDARRRMPGTIAPGWGGFEVAGYAGVPLVTVDGVTMGALAALHDQHRSWRGRDLVVLRSFGEAISAVMDRGRMRHEYDRLEQVAMHDELTGLLNRRGFHLVAEAQLALAHRQGAAGLVLFFDVDNLKVVNDVDGHAVGDDTLCRAAAALRACFREADTIARVGGDEFVVLAIDAPERDLAAIKERLAAGLAGVNSGGRPLAWSLGIAAIDPAQPRSLDALLGEADGRMYAAKRTTNPDLGRGARNAIDPSDRR